MGEVEFQSQGLPPFAFTFLYLPMGVASGFVTVTLSYILAHRGVSVGAIAGLVSLNLLPFAWKVVMGPILDLSLSSVTWVMLSTGVIVVILLIMSFSPLTPQAMPFLDLMSLLLGVAAAAESAAVTAAMAHTTPNAQRGAVAGWQTVGNLGGSGLGGGAGLWLAVHAGGAPVAGLSLALGCAACMAPLWWMGAPPIVHDVGLRGKAAELGRSVWSLLRTRRGVLVAIVSVIPAGLGAASNLFAAVAGDWRASADLVAIVTGVFGGLATIPGCIVGGYLCDRFPRRVVYIWSALICAGGEAAMALAPHTPFWFGAMVLGNACLLGGAYAGCSAVIFDCLGKSGAATVSSLLSSLANLPLVMMVMVVGWAQSKYGSSAMLLTEAGVAVISVAGYAALAYLWRPEASLPPDTAVAAA
jgi:MFS family permease